MSSSVLATFGVLWSGGTQLLVGDIAGYERGHESHRLCNSTLGLLLDSASIWRCKTSVHDIYDTEEP